ncbi:hypothetical protein V502_03768 [Pseudogymnoascus sp. VKM F-4520 (FW-2644)]|nr:hypothetical protein V502_03768 [Pseudogymnoascus sp. VKM F-4520 (FW-2644)]
MADTLSGGRDGGRDGGHGGRRSGKHDGGRNGGRNGKRKSRRNGEARERNEGDGAIDAPGELDGEEEINLPGGPIMPPLDNQQIQNGEGYGIPEGGPGNGWSYAGQNEPILGDGGPENAWSYDGQNEPIPGAQQPSNNNVVQDGQLVGFDELPHYSPFDMWAGNVSRDDDPVALVRFDFDPNGGPPARDA